MRVWVGAILFWFYVAAVQSTQAADDNFLAAQQYYVSPPQGGFVEVAARIQQQSGTTAPAALKHRIVVKDGASVLTPKFLCTLTLHCGGALTEALDCGQDVIC